MGRFVTRIWVLGTGNYGIFFMVNHGTYVFVVILFSLCLKWITVSTNTLFQQPVAMANDLIFRVNLESSTSCLALRLLVC
jgi:hypothetical protein